MSHLSSILFLQSLFRCYSRDSYSQNTKLIRISERVLYNAIALRILNQCFSTKSSPHSLTVFDYLIFVIIRHRRKTIWPGFAIETKASSKLSRRKLRASSLAHARTHAHNQPNSSTHTHTSDITHSRL